MMPYSEFSVIEISHIFERFFLDSISEEEADHLHNALKSYPSSGVDHWRKLAAIFADLGLPREQAEQLENGWAKWIEAAHDGRVAFAQWNLHFDWKGHFHKELEEHKELVGQKLATDFGKSLFQEVWDALAMRSRVASILLDGNLARHDEVFHRQRCGGPPVVSY
jgi:hypothetical protein